MLHRITVVSVLRAVLFYTVSTCSSAAFVGPPLTSYGGDVNFIGTSFGLPGVNASFDYVVVGGGTAGLAIATRLAENATNSVAVVEAGGFYELDNGNLSVVPANAVFYIGAGPNDAQPLIDWGQNTVPQPIDQSLDGRVVHYAQGKTLGGSSARNLLVYQRGTTSAYSMWADQVGDRQYEFPNFLKYFRRSATFTPPKDSTRAANATVPPPTAGAFSSSQGGPVQVTIPNWADSFAGWVRKGLLSMGFPNLQDYVSGTLIGSQLQYHSENPVDQTRSSSETSYLRQALATTDLMVYKNALAKKVLFDDQKKATAVEIDIGGLTSMLEAKQEVIVSSGAFRSPQLLMASGIGPGDTLQQHNIPVIHDLPGVGQNLWDHWFFSVSYSVNVETHSIASSPAFAGQLAEEYRASQSGPLTHVGGDVVGWEKLPESERASLAPSSSQAFDESFPADWPELEYLVTDAASGDPRNFPAGPPSSPNMYASIAALIVAPLSRGNVTIGSSDTADHPIISPNWLASPADQDLMVSAFHRVREFARANATRSVIKEEVYPGPNVTSREDILSFIKSTGLPVWHASATCRMGMANDTMAVVDAQARVFGVRGLRVVDNSAFPLLPPGHPQATTYALAEKIAEDIMQGIQ
ncbi:MAG: hypothetical protein Q9159_000857 [Coniocarpon cinnabarinum]